MIVMHMCDGAGKISPDFIGGCVDISIDEVKYYSTSPLLGTGMLFTLESCLLPTLMQL